MKKFLSIFLAVAFVFSAMCMSVLAASLTGKQHVVGSQGESDSIDNGVSSWTENDLKNNKADITVSFNDKEESTNGSTSTIHNRYAIDITYGSLIIDLTNIKATAANSTAEKIEFVWDVNKHMYVPCTTTNGTVTTTTPDENEKYEIVIENAFSITNHSDLEIYYAPTVSVNDTYKDIIGLSIRTDLTKAEDYNANTDTTEPSLFRVDRAVAGTYVDGTNDTAGSATNGIAHDIVALPAATGATGTQADWLAVINSLSATLTDDEIAGGAVIGTLTINVKATLAQDETAYNATATAIPTP